jgi:hypothetical protein
MTIQASQKIADFPHPISNLERFQLSRFIIQLETGAFYGFNAIFEPLDLSETLFSSGLESSEESLKLFETESGWLNG